MQSVEHNIMFNHQKIGWQPQAIINLALTAINNPNFTISMSNHTFEFEDWGKQEQIKVQVSHYFDWEDRDDGYINSDSQKGMNVIKTVWEVFCYEFSDNQLIEKSLETHDMQNEDFLNWLWRRKDRLLVSEGDVGYSRENNGFLQYGTY